MMTVSVEPEDQEVFRVRFVEDNYVRVHHVWLPLKVWQRLGFDAKPAQVVEAALRIILERDPEARLPARVELSQLADQYPFLKDELARWFGQPPPERRGPPEVA